MRYVSIGGLTEGLFLGQDIIDSAGRLILPQATKLNEQNIILLARIGIPGVYIDDVFTDDIIIKPQLTPQVSTDARNMITKLFGMAHEEELSSEEKAIRDMVSAITDDILDNEDVIKNLVNIRTYDGYTYDHSVEVAVLSGILCAKCGYDRRVIEDCVTAGFLHDIGKVNIDEDIINAPRKLTESERLQILDHPRIGFEMLMRDFNFSEEVNLAVLQHHEWYNGCGYPCKSAGEEITKIARIIKCADVYDAMTTNRPYHHAFTPAEVMEYIMSRNGIEFDPEIVPIMSAELAIYPIGCEIILSDGRHAYVKENNKGFMLRPIIKLKDEGEILDLLNDPKTRNLTIIKVLM